MSNNAENGSGWRRRHWRVAGWGAAAVTLPSPLVAMQYTDEVDWTQSDFAVFAAMLLAVGGTFELAAMKTTDRAYRAAVAVALAAAFILVWVNGAVGIIGNGDNPANLMLYAVPVTGIVGAAIARFRPRGMARAMVATAVAQALVTAIAGFAGLGHAFAMTGFFVALWLTAAWLFRKSGEDAVPRP